MTTRPSGLLVSLPSSSVRLGCDVSICECVGTLEEGRQGRQAGALLSQSQLTSHGLLDLVQHQVHQRVIALQGARHCCDDGGQCLLPGVRPWRRSELGWEGGTKDGHTTYPRGRR